MPITTNFPFQQATYAFPITPSDSTKIVGDPGNTKAYTACAVLVQGTGNVTVITLEGNSVLFTAVPANTILGGTVPLLVSEVKTTGTTATLMIGLAAKYSM